jgi:hypothetical protein
MTRIQVYFKKKKMKRRVRKPLKRGASEKEPDERTTESL